MKKLSYKLKRHLIQRSIREIKRRNKRTEKAREMRISNNAYLQRGAYFKRQFDFDVEADRPKTILLSPKPVFSISERPSNVIEFVSTLKKYAKRAFSRAKIAIDLSHIESIDIGAICMLLSVIEELSYFRIKVTGSVPSDKKCHEIFRDSGFLAHMRTISGDSFLPSTTKNLIIKRGKDRTQNKVVGEAIQHAMEIITGKRGHYQPIFSIVQEINGNSVEHAYDRQAREHWLFAINHIPEENKVIFAFSDNGNGILGTLKRKLTKQFFDALQLKNDEDILRGAFTKKYQSRHEKQINRNKGLPLLKRVQDNQEVKNMFVITNNVFLRIGDYTDVHIDRAFQGTFYYWELDTDCIEKWKKRTQQ